MNFILAQADVAELVRSQSKPSVMGIKEILILCGAFLFAIIISTIIAIRFFKAKPESGRRKRRRSSPEKRTDSSEPNGRRRRRHVRPMNPTLAQTGGLPPKRGDGVPPPPMP